MEWEERSDPDHEAGAWGQEQERRGLIDRTQQPPHASTSSSPSAVHTSHTSPHCSDSKQPVVGLSAATAHLPFSAKLRLIFSRPECLVFFFTTVVMGFGMGMIDSECDQWVKGV